MCNIDIMKDKIILASIDSFHQMTGLILKLLPMRSLNFLGDVKIYPRLGISISLVANPGEMEIATPVFFSAFRT